MSPGRAGGTHSLGTTLNYMHPVSEDDRRVSAPLGISSEPDEAASAGPALALPVQPKLAPIPFKRSEAILARCKAITLNYVAGMASSR